MSEPPSSGREYWPEGGQSRREFLALMAAASATVAISIDAMLPAFGDVREYLGLPSDSSSVALIVTVFFAGLGVGQFVYGPLADRFGLPIHAIGVGEQIDDLAPFDPKDFAMALTGAGA